MAQLVAFTGHTFDQVLDGMTWPRYVALTTVWADWPPLPIAVAILARISPHHQNSTPQQGASNEDAIAELSALIGAPPPE